jgi:hypothetical protein
MCPLLTNDNAKHVPLVPRPVNAQILVFFGKIRVTLCVNRVAEDSTLARKTPPPKKVLPRTATADGGKLPEFDDLSIC